MFESIISAGTSLLGGLFGKSEAAANRAAQEKYAKNSIQWRVEDAKKAGIHPLAAIGATGATYTPVSSGFGDAVAQAGAALGEGVRRNGNAASKRAVAGLNARMTESAIEVNQAQRDLYRAQALNITAEARGKALNQVGGKITTKINPDESTPEEITLRSSDGKNYKAVNPDGVVDLDELIAHYVQKMFRHPGGYSSAEKAQQRKEKFVRQNRSRSGGGGW